MENYRGCHQTNVVIKESALRNQGTFFFCTTNKKFAIFLPQNYTIIIANKEERV